MIKIDDNEDEKKKVADYFHNREVAIKNYLDLFEEVLDDLDYVPMKRAIIWKIHDIKQLCIPSYRFDALSLDTIKKLQKTDLDSLIIGRSLVIYKDLGCSTAFDLLDFHFKRSGSSAYDFCPQGVSQRAVNTVNKLLTSMGINYQILWTK